MTETMPTTNLAVFRGPRERRRIEGRPDTPFAGFWFETDAAALTNGEVECLRRNTYWHDCYRLMAPHIVAWNYVAETVEGIEEPPVYAEDGTTALAPARTVYRVTNLETIPPPAEAGVESLRRVVAIERARGVTVDDGTVAWMLGRLRGYRDELPDEVAAMLKALAAGGTGSPDVTPPTTPAAPSPTNRPKPSRATSSRRGRST